MDISPTIATYTYVYQSVLGVPEYMNFVFRVNWITVFVFGTMVYSIPSIIVFTKILKFYFKNTKEIRKSGLSIEMLQSFLLMQFWNIMAVLSDYLMFRLPSTTILTSFCSSKNPQFLMRLSVFLYYWSTVTAQFLTVLFCVMRVSILFYIQKRHVNLTIIVSVIVIFIGFLTALPHLLTEGVCVQLFEPYPFGSLINISQFYIKNLGPFVSLNLSFTTCTTVFVIILNGMMLMKMKQQKKLNTQIRVSYNSKAERTLTVTMIILLVPLVVSQLASLGQLFHFEFLSYVLLLRPLFVDMRVHVVTVYFYMTHPIFKKKQFVTQSTISQTNNQK